MRRFLLPGFCLAVHATRLLAQPPEPPSFPVRSEVVVLDMVVRDDRGQVVTDLRPEEIVVLEDGVQCPLQSLRLVRAEALATGGATAKLPPAESAGRSRPAGTPPAPRESPLRPNVVLLVFDRLGIEAAGSARRAALEFARREFPPRTWFAVYEIDQRVQVRLRLTADTAALGPAIERATARADRAREPGTTPEHGTLTREALAAALVASGDATGIEGLDPVLAQAIRGAGAVDRMQAEAKAGLGRLADRLDRQALGSSTLHALLAIARELARLEGRKTLLLFSEGLHLPGGLTDLLDTLVGEANRSSLAVYALDPRGLFAEGSFDESRMALLAARARSEQAQRRRDPESYDRNEAQSPEVEQDVEPTEVQMHDVAQDALRLNTQANLRDLAEATGGFLVANTNDLGSGIERIGADLRSYHEVAYYPANPIADGRFRAVEVKVSRRRVSVRARRGYFARTADGAPALEPYVLALAQALDLAAPASDFAHSVSAQLLPGPPGPREVQLAVQVPLHALRFDYDQAERRYRAHFSALVVVRDEAGRVVGRLSHDWPLAGPLVEAESVRNRTATVKRTLELPPADYVLETVVGDRVDGRLSIRRTPLSVPAPVGSP